MTLIAYLNYVRWKSGIRENIESIDHTNELTYCTPSQLSMVQNELTATFKVLDETISRLQREAAELRSENDRLRRKLNEKQLLHSQSYSPSQLAQEILIRFCTLDTTVMSESSLHAAFSESAVATKAAIAELCQHDLLSVLPTASNHEKAYVATSKAMQFVFRTARRGVS